jgi:capsular polysaccharide biosynthesis protein
VLLFELLPRDAQVEAARDADVLIAPHGSALGWMTVMPRGGVVIEASVMNTRTDYTR